MGGQAGQEVLAVLPDRFGDDQRLMGIELAKNLQAHLLRIDEAMLFGRVERMRANDLPAFGAQRLREFVLHFRLFRPAFLVGGEPQIAIGHEIDVSGFECRLLLHDWKNLETLKNCSQFKAQSSQVRPSNGAFTKGSGRSPSHSAARLLKSLV